MKNSPAKPTKLGLVRDWSATVVRASKTLATDKEQMQAFLEAIKGQQELYGVHTPELEQLLKKLGEAKDLPEFLKMIS